MSSQSKNADSNANNIKKAEEKKSNSKKSKSPTGAAAGATTSTYSTASVSGKRKMIAYVQSISPIKRNKKDTLNYSSLVLQTAEGEKQALCFSKSRREMLVERHDKKTAVEIANHTISPDGKIFINDMTHVSNATQGDYFFQFKEIDKDSFSILAEVMETAKGMDLIDTCAKVVSKGDTETVGERKLRMARCVVADTSSSLMTLTVWEGHIESITVGNAYTFNQVRVRERDQGKVLNTCKDTTILPNTDRKLLAIVIDKKAQESIRNRNGDTKSVAVSAVHSIADYESFKQCANNNCNKKIIQETSSFMVKCDHCYCRYRSSDCKENVIIKFVVCDTDGSMIHLTCFKDTVTKLLGSITNLSSDEVCEKILKLKNLNITFNKQMVALKIEQK